MNVYLGSGVHITVDAPGHTVKWYVEGDLKLHHEPSTLTVTPDTTLIIYAHGKVQLEKSASLGGAVNNPGTPDNLQIYKYSSDEMKISGGSTFNAFIFAPFSKVTITDANTIKGLIWAKSYKSTSGGVFANQAEKLKINNLPTGFYSGSAQNQITPTATWQKQER